MVQMSVINKIIEVLEMFICQKNLKKKGGWEERNKTRLNFS